MQGFTQNTCSPINTQTLLFIFVRHKAVLTANEHGINVFAVIDERWYCMPFSWDTSDEDGEKEVIFNAMVALYGIGR